LSKRSEFSLRPARRAIDDGVAVTWELLQKQWERCAALARSEWKLLSERDLQVIAGNRERLVGVLQQRYGMQKRVIERQVRAFTRSCAHLL
jgi:hypothetical protein